MNTLRIKHIPLDCVSCLQKIIFTYPTKAIKPTSHFHIKMRYARTDTPQVCQYLYVQHPLKIEALS